MSTIKTLQELFDTYTADMQIRVDVISDPEDPTDKAEIFEDVMSIENAGQMYKVYTASSNFFAPASHEVVTKIRGE